MASQEIIECNCLAYRPRYNLVEKQSFHSISRRDPDKWD